MFEIKGKYNNAIIYTENIEEEALKQIISICNEESMSDTKIRIMPDCHAGAGCTIGTTMTIKNKVIPNLVGVDIGCGMYVIQLKESEIDFLKLDNLIRNQIPHGMNILDKESPYVKKINFNNLISKNSVNIDRAKKSLGTLGGGNHFIEIAKEKDDTLYLIIHSGSRNLGKNVAEYYQDIAYKKLLNTENKKQEIINQLKLEGREKDIQKELQKLNTDTKINRELAYLQGEDFLNYINDMRIVQHFASINRIAIANKILSGLNLTKVSEFTTIHNYIDLDSMILRKGAVSAKRQERLIIPINMAEGSLLCTGLGNENWNYSAPHGAGRIFSRSKAKEYLSLNDFKEQMKEVWSTSVGENTLDESPMAYKPMNEIIKNTIETVVLDAIIKPVYNFKSS